MILSPLSLARSAGQPNRQVLPQRGHSTDNGRRLHVRLCAEQNDVRERVPHAHPRRPAELSDDLRFYGQHHERVSTRWAGGVAVHRVALKRFEIRVLL